MKTVSKKIISILAFGLFVAQASFAQDADSDQVVKALGLLSKNRFKMESQCVVDTKADNGTFKILLTITARQKRYYAKSHFVRVRPVELFGQTKSADSTLLRRTKTKAFVPSKKGSKLIFTKLSEGISIIQAIQVRKDNSGISRLYVDAISQSCTEAATAPIVVPTATPTAIPTATTQPTLTPTPVSTFTPTAPPTETLTEVPVSTPTNTPFPTMMEFL